jgi:hypothetical protein
VKTDTLIKNEGMEILTKYLGMVEAERFIMLIQREPFDYAQKTKLLPALQGAAPSFWEELCMLSFYLIASDKPLMYKVYDIQGFTKALLSRSRSSSG